LIEEISESKQYIINDAERKWHGKQILDNCKNMHDSLSDCIADREAIVYRKEILESQVEKEKTADLQESIDDSNKTGEQITC